VSALDVALVGAGIGALFLAGVLFKRRQLSAYEFFAGSRSIPWQAACLSLVATETSGITFLGVPELAFRGNWTFLQMAFGYVIGRVLVAWLLIASVRRRAFTSVYEYLGPSSGRLVACVFVVTRVLADGVRLFVTAVPLQLATGLDLEWCILAVVAVTAAYSLMGGIRGIVWVDTAQLLIYLAGAAASVVIAVSLTDDFPGKLAEAFASGKLVIFDSSFALNRFTLWAGLIGGAAFSFASHGTDHLMAQRYLLVRTDREARKVVVASGLAVTAQFALFLFLGTCLFCLWPDRSFPQQNRLYAAFIVEKLPSGIRGLVLAGVFGAAMSTLSSSINALAASGLRDIGIGLLGLKKRLAESLFWGRLVSLGAAAALAACALGFARAAENMVNLAMGIASITYGGILGAFLAKRFMNVGDRSCAAALAAGSLWSGYLFFFPLPILGRIFWPWLVPSGAAVALLTVWTGRTLHRVLSGRSDLVQ